MESPSPTSTRLSWDEKQPLAGVILESNAEKFELFSYVGDPRANPALAGPKDWKRLLFVSRFAVQLGEGVAVDVTPRHRPARERIAAGRGND